MEQVPSTPIAETPTGVGPVPVKRQPFSRKFIGIVIAFFVVLIAGIAGFILISNRNSSSQSEVKNRQVALSYWGLWENNEALQSVINDFQLQNPGVTVQYSQQSPKDYRERLVSAFARGQGPDIFRFHASWVPMLNQTKTLSTVPTSVLSESDFSSLYYPAVTADLKTANGYTGVPLMTDGLGLYINKRLLTTAGKSVPTTWEDLRLLAVQLTVRGADGSIERSGVALGSANNVDHFSDILGVLIFQNGGNPGVIDNLVQDALTFYTQFEKEDRVWDETLPNSTYAFAIEKTAMMIAPSWRAFEIKQINPNFEFEIAPIPQLPGKPVTWASYWVEGVAASSKEQDLAWKFIKHLSQKETLQKLHNKASSQRLFGEIYPRTDMGPSLEKDQYMGAYIRQAPTARSWYLNSRTFDNGVNDQIIKYYKDAINAIHASKRMEELIPILTQGVAQVLTSYGIRP